jgi:DNA-directed RNA polymerase specialized sigma24 family protein/ribosome-associated translation inhibitor RaiA
MTHQLSLRGSQDREEVRRWLERPLARLRRQLARFPADAVHLRTVVREAEGGRRAEAAIALQLPSRTLAASEEGATARAALREAFDELARQLEKEKARLRRARDRRRSHEELRRTLLARAAASEPGPSPTAEDIDRQLREVESYAQQELRWLEWNGDLVTGEVDVGDVVDGAFSRALARTPRPDRRLLLQCATAALRDEVERVRRARAQLRIEEEVPALPPEEAAASLGSEILDFYQPDEGVTREELLVGLVRTPEEIEASAEALEVLRRALASLPPSWRQALHLQEVERLDPLAIAEALEVEQQAVPERVERARVFLRDWLREAGVLAPAGRERMQAGGGALAEPGSGARSAQALG